MKGSLLFLVLACVGADKLDLTYLPPPGSQYSGGRPEDIQVPFEFPKETYSTTLKPQTTPISSGELNPQDYQATIGINRGLPPQNLNIGPRGQIGSVSNIQNPYKVPTTTVSYAFTQTTTHPPSESFETTISPLNTATGFPVTGPLDEPTFQPDSFNEQNIHTQNRPGNSGYEAVDQFGQLQPTNVPRPGKITEFPSSLTQSQQSVFDQNRPVQPGFSTFNKPSFQGSGLLYEQNINTQNRPDESSYKVVDELGQLQPSNVPRPGNIAQFPGSQVHSQVPVFGQNHPVQSQPNFFSQFQQGNKQPSSVAPDFASQIPFGQNQYSGNETVKENISPQRIQTNLRPGEASVIGGNVNGPQGLTTVQPNIPQGSLNEQQLGQAGIPTSSTQIPPARLQNTGGYATQQYPGYSDSYDDSRDGVLQNTFRPPTTTAPFGSLTSIPDQEYSIGSSVGPKEYYSTPAYPGTRGNVAPTRHRNRPERPQAESDRNAVILNYNNVITPDGYFAYSFDTSNGIHADESGDANGGVKAKGSYSYTGDDGKVYTVVYTADENGFRPQGSHLPTPPPVPEAIQKIIDRVKQEKEAGITHDGFYDEKKYGHKKLKDSTSRIPQTSSNGILNGNDLSFDNILGEPNENRQHGTQEDSIATINDYNTLKQQDRQEYYDDSDNVPKRISQFSPLRYSDLNTGLQDTTSVKQPSNLATQKQHQQGKSPNYRNEENIRHRISIPTSSLANGLQQQNVDQTTFTEPIESQNQGNIRDYVDNGNTRGSNIQGSSRNPITRIDTQNRNKEFDSLKENLDRPGSGPFDRLDNLTPFGKVSIENAKQSLGKLPLNDDLNGTSLPNGINKYRSNENLTKGQSLMNQPGYGTRPDKEPQKYVGQTVSSGRRPGQGGFIVTQPGINKVNSEYGLKTDTFPEEDTKADYVPVDGYGFRKILGNDQTPNMDNQQYLPENARQKVISLQPKIGSIASIDRKSQKQVPVQGNRFSNLENTSVNVPDFNRQDSNGQSQKQVPVQGNRFSNLENTSVNVPDFNRQDSNGQSQKQVPVQGNRFSNLQNTSVNVPDFNRQDSNGRQTFNQHAGISRTNNLPQFKETGYQYIPPQTKFNQDERNKNPFRLNDANYTSTAGKPSQSFYYDTKDATAKPFITPNVSRVDKNDSGEDYDEEQFIPGNTDLPQDHIKQNYDEKYDAVRVPQYTQTETTPDQVSGDEIISSTRLPNYSTTRGSTYHPTYDKTTRKPAQQYNPIPTYNNVANGTIKPYPSKDDDRKEFKIKAPYNFVTSTMPIPTRTRNFGSTQPDTVVPGSETYYNRETNRPIQPENGFILSTTPIPQGSRLDGSYPQNMKTQYQKTYMPLENIRPTTEYYDRTVSSKLPYGTTTNAPFGYTQAMKYGDRIPSSTYRPVDTNRQSTSTPSTQYDRFGRPIYNYQQGSVGDQYQTSPSRDSQGRPVYDSNSRVQYQPNNDIKQQQGLHVQPSTERVIGEDFSGPKQPQYFDSETGYHYK